MVYQFDEILKCTTPVYLKMKFKQGFGIEVKRNLDEQLG